MPAQSPASLGTRDVESPDVETEHAHVANWQADGDREPHRFDREPAHLDPSLAVRSALGANALHRLAWRSAARQELQLAPPQAGRVAGRLRRANGDPVAGVPLLIGGCAIHTDAKGEFAAASVDLGPQRGASAFVDGSWVPIDCAWDSQSGDAFHRLELLLPSTLPFAVTVRRLADGLPVPGADVEITSFDGGARAVVTAVTGAGGRAEVRVPRCGEFIVRAWAPDSGVGESDMVPIPWHGEVVVAVPDRRPTYARGRVLRPDGSPKSGALVRLRSDAAAADSFSDSTPRPALPSPPVRTERDGSFSLPILARLDARHRWPGVSRHPRVSVEVDSSDATHPAVFWIQPDVPVDCSLPTPVNITGVVVDSEGGRPPEFRVRFEDSTGYTTPAEYLAPGDDLLVRDEPGGTGRRFTLRRASGRAGRLVVSSFVPMPMALVATHDVTASIERTIDVGRLVLRPSQLVELSDPARELTPPGVLVRMPDDAGRPVPMRGGVRGSVGSWTTPPDEYAGGRCRLVAVAEGRLAVDLGERQVAACALTLVEAHLPAPATIDLVCRRGERSVPGVDVSVELPECPKGTADLRTAVWYDIVAGDWVRLNGAEFRLRQSTDAMGRACFRRLPPGRVRVLIHESQREEPTVVDRLLAEGEAAYVEVDLAR